MILSVFCNCKDVKFLTLLNHPDKYVPLVLSIYSIVFNCDKYEFFFQSLLHCWFRFVVFRRRPYNKALLVTLSTFIGKEMPLLCSKPCVNTWPLSVKKKDQGDQFDSKAKGIDACKHELHSFKHELQSVSVPPRKF
jgi:hypothetical protein